MARTYQKSEAQWQKQYMNYLEQWGKSQFTRGKMQAQYATSKAPLTMDQFKIYYDIAKQTLQAGGKSTAGVYKELVEVGPAKTGPYTLSKASAKALQQKLNEREKAKPVKERYYYTIKELRLFGGKMASEFNDLLKEEHPDWTGKQRADYIGEELYGSP